MTVLPSRSVCFHSLEYWFLYLQLIKALTSLIRLFESSYLNTLNRHPLLAHDRAGQTRFRPSPQYVLARSLLLTVELDTGIMFKDVTTLVLNPTAFKHTIDLFVEHYKDLNLTAVAGTGMCIKCFLWRVICCRRNGSFDFNHRLTSHGVAAGIEARGFVFAPPIALALGLKFVMLRKPNKLPGQLSASLSSYLLQLHSFPPQPLESSPPSFEDGGIRGCRNPGQYFAHHMMRHAFHGTPAV